MFDTEYTIDYKFRGQSFCRSHLYHQSKKDIIYFLERIINFPHDKDYCDIDLIVFNLTDTPIAFTIQLSRNEIRHSCGICFKKYDDWEITLIFNDCTIGKINTIGDLITFLKLL
ncbi:MAG: hypothetical protein WC516_06040 [Patescibacteria group bacterium]|jgi:hypothetical protein